MGRAIRAGLAPQPLPPRRVGPLSRLRLTVEILVAYVELLRLLRISDLPTMAERARSSRVPTRPVEPSERFLTAVRIGRMVQRVISKLPTDSRCLIHSLVVIRLLAHREIDGRLVIGVQSDPDGLTAHAWVEHETRPILPAGEYDRLVEV